MDAPLRCNVRARRGTLGLTQAELAAKVGISRQSLAAIEAQRQVPSTIVAIQLANALSCDVGDLFQLIHDAEVLAVRAPDGVTRRVRLATVRGRVVAIGVRDGQRADGVVVGEHVTGRVRVRAHEPAASWEDSLVVVGCAPLLGALAQRFSEWTDQSAIWVHANSTEALHWLGSGFAHLAGLHRSNDTNPQANAQAAASLFPTRSTAVVHLTAWNQGIVTAPANPFLLGSQTLNQRRIRWVWREVGSAARTVLETMVVPDTNALTARHHEEVAQIVRAGAADAGIAIESVAHTYDLGFVPIQRESFDLVVHPDVADSPVTQRFLDLLNQPSVIADLGASSGYDLSGLGTCTIVGPTP